MSNSLKHGVGLLPAPSDSPGTALGGVALFAGVFLLFMGFKEYSGSSTVDSGLRKIGLGIVAVVVGVGIAATRQTSSLKKDEHAS